MQHSIHTSAVSDFPWKTSQQQAGGRVALYLAAASPVERFYFRRPLTSKLQVLPKRSIQQQTQGRLLRIQKKTEHRALNDTQGHKNTSQALLEELSRQTRQPTQDEKGVTCLSACDQYLVRILPRALDLQRWPTRALSSREGPATGLQSEPTPERRPMLRRHRRRCLEPRRQRKQKTLTRTVWYAYV